MGASLLRRSVAIQATVNASMVDLDVEATQLEDQLGSRITIDLNFAHLVLIFGQPVRCGASLV